MASWDEGGTAKEARADVEPPRETSTAPTVAATAPGTGLFPAGVPPMVLQRKIQARAAKVQRFSQGDAGAPSGEQLHQAAEAGIGAGGGSLPHAAAIQRSFGPAHDVSGVVAHVGGAAAKASDAIGAEGYATGNHVAFKESPDLHLAAHEAAHVMQQRDGVHLSSSGVGEHGDSYEQHADSVADRVVRGESAADLLSGNTVGGGGQAPVQRYTEFGKAEQAKGDWKTTHGPVRVADTGDMAVAQESYAGSQWFWAEPGLIASSSSKLEAAGSRIRLVGGSSKITGHVPGAATQKTLTQVQPKNLENNTKGRKMDLPADCGKAAGSVMGAGHGKNSDIRRALYHGEGGGADTADGDPQQMKWTVLKPYLLKMNGSDGKPAWTSGFEAQEKQLIAQRDSVASRWSASSDNKEKEKLVALYGQIGGQIDLLYAEALKRLTEPQRQELSKKAHINEFAAPQVGQAYVVSSGGNPKKEDDGSDKMTWNFHWGGVVMASGADNVTLENYATGVPDAQNKDWVFQMYGAPNAKGDVKKGQSFHEQTRDVHQQHGDMPTTMAVEPKPK